MSGLFRRLASQLVGPPPLRVHSMARLPFSAPPELKQDDVSGIGVAAKADARVERNESGEAAARAAPLRTPAGDADAAQGPMPRLPSGLLEGRDAPPTETRRPENDLGLGRVQDSQGEVRRAGQGPVLPTGARAQTQGAVHAGIEAQQSGATSGYGPGRGVALPEIVTQRSRSPRDLDRFPPPLLARAEPPAASPADRAPAAPAGAAGPRPNAPSPDGPNEVHVHIGRIEVTAVQETPPRRAVRNRPPTLSLDEYLARRQRGAS